MFEPLDHFDYWFFRHNVLPCQTLRTVVPDSAFQRVGGLSGYRLWAICRLKTTAHDSVVSSQNITQRFGLRLRALRQKHGWTQVEMAEKFGIDRAYISDMERGKKNVCLPTLEIIAKGFGITISQVLKGL